MLVGGWSFGKKDGKKDWGSVGEKRVRNDRGKRRTGGRFGNVRERKDVRNFKKRRRRVGGMLGRTRAGGM